MEKYINYIYATDNHITNFTNNMNAEEHKHKMLQLFIAVEDSLEIIVEGKDIVFKGIIVNSEINHKFAANNKTCLHMLIDSTSYLGEELKKLYIKESNYYIFKEQVNDLIIYIKENFPINNKELYDCFYKYLLKCLQIGEYSMLNYDERIIKVLDYLKHCTNPEHSLKEIASEVYLSESRLSHLFKEKMGISLMSYILLHKIKKSYYKLFETGNITEAAMYGGFNSPSHFTATSKKIIGTSPSFVRKDSVFLKVSEP